MRIDKIDLYLVEHHFNNPWKTAYGSDSGSCALFTRITSGSHEGWSESCPLSSPNYSPEYGKGVFHVARRFLAPRVIGRDFSSARELNDAMRHVKGNPFAKAGIEMAWWTLEAALRSITIGRLLGTEAKEVAVGDSWGVCDSYDELIANIDNSFLAGYKRVKLKVMHGWDTKMLEAVRSTFRNETIHIDCNASYTIDEAEVFRGMDRFHLAMIEQPFQSGDLIDHAKLQSRIDTPICLDESITEPWQAEQAAELHACGYINLKPARVGGLQNLLDINRICMQAGIGCWIGGMMESDVGKAICVEAASLANMEYPNDITPESDNYPDRISDCALVFSTPCMFRTSTRTGTPILPNVPKLMEKLVASCSCRADDNG